MAPTTTIMAPPYPVQSTATELHSGFPCFPWHESISALWAQKWRVSCDHGVYPFTDAKVEDFAPTFAELVKVSGDNPDILNQPDAYGAPFFPVAERLVRLAE